MDYSTTDFSQPWPRADRIFLVEDRKVYVNETVLTMASPVFSAMFTGDFQEKTMKEIPLPDKNYDAFIKLMEMVHPPHRELTRELIILLLPLFNEYQMDYLKQKCERYWLSRNGGYYKRLALADKYNMPKLYEECLFTNVRCTSVAVDYMDPEDEEYEDEDIEDETWCQVLSMKLNCFEKRVGLVTCPEAQKYVYTISHFCDVYGLRRKLAKLKIQCVPATLTLPLNHLIYSYDSGLLDRRTLAQLLALKVDMYERNHGDLLSEEVEWCMENGFQTAFGKDPTPKQEETL